MMYSKTFGASNDLGYGTTVAFALFVVILAITYVYLRIVEAENRASKGGAG